MTDPNSAPIFVFGGFRLEPQRRLLFRVGDGPVPLSDKAFDALVCLVEHAGRLVTKDELLRALWPITVVEESSLYAALSALRRALKDEAAASRLIATIAGRGYRFVATVQRAAVASPLAAGDAIATQASRKSRLWVSGAAAIAIAIAIGVVGYAVRDTPESRPAAVQVTLAVLPLKPLTPADRNESLELGMTETLISGLNSGNLSVSPLSSVRRFAGMDQHGLAAGRELGVQTVPEGHIQRAGEQLRVSARLLNVTDGRQLWAPRFDERFTDIFLVQDAIAEKMRSALAIELDAEDSPALRRYTQDAEAYQLYANGREHFYRLALPETLAYFEQAIARDPEFALAPAAISEVHAGFGVFGMVAPHDTFPQAQRAVQRALELAPGLGDARGADTNRPANNPIHPTGDSGAD